MQLLGYEQRKIIVASREALLVTLHPIRYEAIAWQSAGKKVKALYLQTLSI